MHITRSILFAVLIAAFGSSQQVVRAAGADAVDPSAGLQSREWTVDGVKREALIHVPADAKKPAPLVFVFHGHGGGSRQVSRSFGIHEIWPEAIVVYPQGLNTPGRLTDPKGEVPGWQFARGEQGDRDLKFFDAMLASIRSTQHVDNARIDVTGHSNGGSFAYMLLAARGDTFAAVAPSGAVDALDVRDMKPKPLFHVAGKQDPLVKFEWQRRMIDAMLAIDQCDAKAGKEDGPLTTYPSKIGTPVVTYLYDGGHAFPARCRRRS